MLRGTPGSLKIWLPLSAILLMAFALWRSWPSRYSRARDIDRHTYEVLQAQQAYQESPLFDASRPALVAAGSDSHNVAWMTELSSIFDLYPYNVDVPPAAKNLQIPKNKGREAMVYLTYIIEQYDQLPPYAIFTHGHNRSWHQEDDLVPLLRDLRTDALNEVGYISLRCSWIPGCPAEMRPHAHDDPQAEPPEAIVDDTERDIIEAWPTLFPDEALPDIIASACCAQFAVTRDAIRRRSKDDYLRMREWLLQTPVGDDLSGRVFEKLWAFIMSGEGVNCPTQNDCACNYFGRCEGHD